MDNKKKNGMRSRYDEDMDWLDDDDDYLDDGGLIGSLLFLSLIHISEPTRH